MKRVFLLLGASLVMSLVLAPTATAQASCPAGQVSVLTDGGFICVPANIEDQTTAEIDAIVNDPRPNTETETEIVENQVVPEQGDLTPAQQRTSGNVGNISAPTTTQVQSSAALAENAPVPPAYEVEGNTVTIGGDVQTDCRSFAISLQQGYDQGLSPAQQQEALAQCEAQGTSAPNVDTLPDTGGLPLGVLAAGLVAALVGGGLLVRERLS